MRSIIKLNRPPRPKLLTMHDSASPLYALNEVDFDLVCVPCIEPRLPPLQLGPFDLALNCPQPSTDPVLWARNARISYMREY
jgi:hypothetical protein